MRRSISLAAATAARVWHRHCGKAPRNPRNQSVGTRGPTAARWPPAPFAHHRLAAPLSWRRCGQVPSTSRASCWLPTAMDRCVQARDRWREQTCRAAASWERRLGGNRCKRRQVPRRAPQLRTRGVCATKPPARNRQLRALGRQRLAAPSKGSSASADDIDPQTRASKLQVRFA